MTFTGETASGWQQANFATPVSIAANTTYVASYHTDAGGYAADANYFATAGVDNGPLHALATTVSPNGVYQYGSGGFPTASYNATNYWVDVVFDTTGPDTTPPTVTALTPPGGATGVGTTTAVTATFSEALNPATISGTTFTLTALGEGGAVAATVGYDPGTNVATLIPASPLASGTAYTATVVGGPSGVRDLAGNALAATTTWSFTTGAPDTTPPTVSNFAPANGAIGVSTTAAVTATFSEALNPSTLSGATFASPDPAAPRWQPRSPTTPGPASPPSPPRVRSPSARPTPSRSSAARTASRTSPATPSWPTSLRPLPPRRHSPAGCPCTIWTPTATPGLASENDNQPVELGVKFRSDLAGVVTGLRFYKGSANGGTHVGNLWTSTGQLLGTVTFTNETGSGWQQANFSTPIQIAANTTYVASYRTTVGFYAADSAYFASGGTDRPPLHALGNSVSPNGVYQYGAGGFPTDTFNATNYWVDVVFDTTETLADATPPTVVGVSPPGGGVGVSPAANVVVTFSDPMNSTSISTTTVELRSAADAVVPATVTYDGGTQTATLQPIDALAPSAMYTLTVHGGTTGSRVTDTAGNALTADFTSSFSTASATTPPPLGQGPGGPVLVITSARNPFGTYYAEILGAEGLNLFSVADLSTVTPSVLAGYDVAILGEMPLTAAQATMLSDWVNAGGNLIAMRPDKQLAPLLGLADAGSTLSDAYLLVDTSKAPGAGIVGETLQFHGPADLYTLHGATAVATLYSNATAPTSNPAVTLRSVGSVGGQVAAFTYDLARSVVYTRQGNPAWVGQERDGLRPFAPTTCSLAPPASTTSPTGSTSPRSPFPRLTSSSDCSPT